MASRSAPRARSSDSRVVCASPSPEKAISTRHASDASSAVPRALAAGPSAAAPAGGWAATVPPGCWLRAAWMVSAPAQTGAAMPLPCSVRSSGPGRSGWADQPAAEVASARPDATPPRLPSRSGGGSGGGGGGCGS
eukprot:2130086-Pleurochrysis_carterae.AAC.1